MGSYINYGVRNVPVFTTMVRTRLGWDRKTLAKFLGIGAKDVYYIELGKLPSELVVYRLKLLEKYEPLLTYLSTILIQIYYPLARIRAMFNYLYMRASGKLNESGQLVLDCSKRIDLSVFTYYPVLFCFTFFKTLLSLLVVCANLWFFSILT